MKARAKAELLLFSITLIWGSTFVVTKGALESISPFLYVALRFSLAAIIFILFQPHVLKLNREVLLKGGFLGFLLFVGFSVQTMGLQYTTASKSAFITGMLVVLTPICQVVIEKRMPKIGNVIGVALVTIGLYFLTSPEGSGMNTGDWLTLGCALSWALYIVYLDIYGSKYDAAQLTFAQFLVSIVGGAIGAIFLEESRFVPAFELYGALAYLAVFATVIALFVQTKYQKETTPTRAAVIFSVEPVFAAIIAYIVLDEMIGSLGMVGGGLIVVGLLVSELSDVVFRPQKVKEQHAG
ncbi:MAG: DMT family transporter [Ignavibacteriae bacterium]|nr:DMT family transporter [Ignavibacteriota bacterium]